MMKRFMQYAVACAVVLSLVSFAAAQSRPEPVTRMGDWVEISPDVMMNFLYSNNIYYRWTDNLDFEEDRKDATNSGNPDSSILRLGEGDHLVTEARFGWDMRYKKNLRARMFFEAEIVMDGAQVDSDTDGIHIERFWIDYKMPGTPVRMRVGAWLWSSDLAREVADDDPGFHLFIEQGPLQIWLAAIVEEESSLGPADGSGTGTNETNDNDHMRYLFNIRYTSKPHTVCLCINFERDRNRDDGATEHDYVVIHPGYNGKVGPVTILAQFNVGFGEATNEVTNDDYDIFTWGAVAAVDIDLGMVHPILGIIVGSADDDNNDEDLNGYFGMADNEINLTGFGGPFTVQDGGVINDWIVAPAGAPIAGGATGHHTVYSAFNDKIANGVNTQSDGSGGVLSPLSNPGTLALVAGAKIFPTAGHEIRVWYVYWSMLDSKIVEQATGENIDEALFHEIGVKWLWTLNKHFSFRPRAYVIIPADGAKDIAETQNICGDGTEECDGDDIGFAGEIRFRATF